MLRYMMLVMSCGFICLLAGCPKAKPEAEEGGMSAMMRPFAVIVEPVTLQDYASAVTLVGEMRAAQRTVLTAEVSGAVTHIAHRVGERHEGGALIQIDPANYEVSLAAAQAQLAQAQEGLKLAQAGPRAQEIAAQEAQVAAALARSNQAQDYLERQRMLYTQGVIAETALIAAEAAAQEAASALKAQQEVLDQLREGSRPEDLASAEAAVKAAQSGVAAAELALAKTSVAPPFTAVVSALFVEEGQFVGPGTPLAEVVADSTAEAWFNLPEDYLGQIGPGNTVEIRSDVYPDEVFMGQIISISPQADETTRQFPTRVQITDKRLLPGMAIEGRLYLEQPQPTIMIPRDAVISATAGEVVYIMDMASMAPPAGASEGGAGTAQSGGAPGAASADPAEMMKSLPKVKMIIVKTGDTVGRLAAVLEGDLQPGMMIVSRGGEQLYEGASIIPANLMGKQGGAPTGAGDGQPPAANADPTASASPAQPSGNQSDNQPPAPGTPAAPEAPAEGEGK